MESTSEDISRIFGGLETGSHQYPWMVSIHCSTGNTESFHCVGVLVSNQWVLTAASCIHGWDIKTNTKLFLKKFLTINTKKNQFVKNYNTALCYCLYNHELDLKWLDFNVLFDKITNLRFIKYRTPTSFLHVSVANHNLYDNTTGISLQVVDSYDLGYNRITHEKDALLLKVRYINPFKN